MAWQVEIGTVSDLSNKLTASPFFRKVVPLELVELTVRQEMARLTDLLVKTHGAGWHLEKLVYIRVRPLNGPLPPSSSSPKG